MGKASKDRRDVYYRKAKEEAYRARSAYKLIGVDDEFDIFHKNSGEPIRRVVDLCAAPGSWSQVIKESLDPAIKPLIVAVDLQEIAPIPGVITLRGDISSDQTVEGIKNIFGNEPADLIVCDGAPDVTGLHDIDENLQHRLLMAALRISLFLLRPGCTMVAKVFRGRHIAWLLRQLGLFFDQLHCVKPAASRMTSLEAFVVCRGFKEVKGYNIRLNDNYMVFHNWIMELMGKGLTADLKPQPTWIRIPDAVRGGAGVNSNGLEVYRCAGQITSDSDPDKTYALEEGHVVREPTMPPLSAAYLDAVDDRRGKQTRV